ncbi:hypothetical protein GCM10029963_28700 [Micromonospora andamanensis]|nr:hypothetical protein Vwe01_18200 [Micromonospora andamanensis]
MPDPREAKLPRWARDEMARLRKVADQCEARIAEAERQAERARLATDPDGSDTVLEPYGDEIGLGNGKRVRFRLPGRDRLRQWVDVRVTRYGTVELMGGDALTLHPSASNVLNVAVRDH